MSEYIIYRKTPCILHGLIDCNGTMGCLGYEVVPVDADEWLLDRLAKLRWDAPLPGYDEIVETKEMTNPRFEENK